jgi:hypothetical protein
MKYWDGAAIPGEKNKDFDENQSEQSYQNERKKRAVELILKYYNECKQSLEKKQKLTSKMIYQYVSKFLNISYQTICRYIQELNIISKEIYIPLSFEPGEVMQVDWCEVSVDIDGQRHSLPVFCAVLPYSGYIYAMINLNMKMENWLLAHIEAFKYIGGVPDLIFYDNTKTGTISGAGKSAIVHPKFKMLAAHYVFEPRFMGPYKPNQKGCVENLCKTIRLIAFTPIPKAFSLKELQIMIINKITKHNNTHKLKTRKAPIKELFEVEKQILKSLPIREFHPIPMKKVAVNDSLLFTYNTSKYSVPFKYHNIPITIQITPYEILCWYNGKLICTHTQSILKEQKIYIAEHYLEILQFKTRAIEHAEPLKYGILPKELAIFRDKCQDKNKLEQLINLMLLCKTIDTDVVLQAVDEANKSKNYNYTYVVNIIKLKTDTFTEDDLKELITGQNTPIIVKNNSLDDYNKLIPNNDNVIDIEICNDNIDIDDK